MPSWQMGALGQLLLSAGRLSLPGWGMCCGVVLVAGVWADGSCWYSRAWRLLSKVESAFGISLSVSSLQMVKLVNDTAGQ